MTVRTLIVDDEGPARRALRLLVAEVEDFEVVGECADGEEAVAAIRALRPDLVFLDIQMPVMDGFALVAEMGLEAMPLTLFVTAYDQHALRAFEAHALDYLLKPIDPVRFHRSVERARDLLESQRLGEATRRLQGLLDRLDEEPEADRAATAATPPLERFLVKSRGRTAIVPVEEVDWIEADDDYVYLHTPKRRYLLRATLKALSRQLDPGRFQRIHRGAIVQLDRLVEIRPTPHGDCEAHLRDGTRLRLSRSYRGRVENALRSAP